MLQAQLEQRWKYEIEAVQRWETEQGEIGVFRSKVHGSISLVIAVKDTDALVILTYASLQSALEDARIIADAACAW